MEVATLVFQAILVISAATTSIVAVKNMSQWKRPLLGGLQLRVANKALILLHKLRQELDTVRFHATAVPHLIFPPDEFIKNNPFNDQDKHISVLLKHMMENGLKELFSIHEKLRVHAIHVEAHFGDAVKESLDAVLKKDNELLMNFKFHLTDTYDPSSPEKDKDVDKVIFSNFHKEKDEWFREYSSLVDNSSTLLKSCMSKIK